MKPPATFRLPQRGGFVWIGGLVLTLTIVCLLAGCGNDEDSGNTHPGARPIIGLTYENPLVISIDDASKRALLLHGRLASSGPALQYVDLAGRRVIATRILVDYFDVYDAVILPAAKGCFAGKPHGNRGYAVHFFSLPDLVLGTQIMTADTSGVHGYLAVDSVTQTLYYSHTGGGDKDGIYGINITSEALLDADQDGRPPFAFDNDLVAGLFDQPASLHFDAVTRKLIVANLGNDFITMLDASLWGTLNRATNYSFPITGTAHLSTLSGGLTTVRPQAMGYGAGVYVFAGQASNRPFLARFTVESLGLDLLETPLVSEWVLSNHVLPVDARSSVVSLFIAQRNEARIRVGQYRLNNLAAVAGSPHAVQVIPDSSIGVIAVLPSQNKIIVADKSTPRLELLEANR